MYYGLILTFYLTGLVCPVATPLLKKKLDKTVRMLPRYTDRLSQSHYTIKSPHDASISERELSLLPIVTMVTILLLWEYFEKIK